MMANIRSPLARRLMVGIVVMDVQNYWSAVRFRQRVYDGNLAIDRKRQCRTENAKRVKCGNQGCHPNPSAPSLHNQHPDRLNTEASVA